MVKEETLARYLEALLQGDRSTCRSVIEETMQRGVPANSIYLHLIWPVMAEIERLSRTGSDHLRPGAPGDADQPHDRGPVAE